MGGKKAGKKDLIYSEKEHNKWLSEDIFKSVGKTTSFGSFTLNYRSNKSPSFSAEI